MVRPVAKTTAEHQHAKVGGGTKTHTHAFDPADEHGHSTPEPGLLPLPEAAGQKAARKAGGTVSAAELTSKQRGNLDASDFAWVDSDGTGHLPIHDATHVRNAIARFNQTSFPDTATKKKAAAAIRAAAKRFGIEVDDDSAVAQLSEGRSALIAVAGSDVNLAERRLPYLTVGEWEFPDYGTVSVGPAELRSVVEHFKANVRGQDLPLCDVDHVDPIFRGLACGWVQDLVLDDAEAPSRIDAVVDLNEAGEQLVQQDRVRYTSPTLLRNWTDPSTGITYPFVAAGVDVRTRDSHGESAMAVTNFPRLKQLGRIACSEDGAPRAALLAMGEAAAPTPARAARLLMQEDADSDTDPDSDGDDDGPVPPCAYQPGQLVGGCPGFTRWPGDDDGDGTCLMATRGCNGYRAVADDTQVPWRFSEGHRMPDDDVGQMSGSAPAPSGQQVPPAQQPVPQPPGAPPATPSQPVQPPAQAPEQPTAPQPTAPPQSAPQPAPAPQTAATGDTQRAADAAEGQAIRAAELRSLTERITAAEQRVAAAEQRASTAETRLQSAEAELHAMRMAEKVGRLGDRIQACLRTGRIDKAEYDRLMAPERLASFAENDAMLWVLESIEQRPAASAVPLGERGTGTTPNPSDESAAAAALSQKANELVAAAAARGERMPYSEAAKRAARELPGPAQIAYRGGA
jgi:Family of unknown function (DUF6582)